MDSCKIILSQLLYGFESYNLNQWSILFPMEYIFEAFVAGFLQTYFKDDWKVEYQKSNEFLSNTPKAFNMQHDIFLTSKDGKGRKIIIDTKYKLRDSNFKDDVKKGVLQADLYQLISYVFKRGCTELFILYPNVSEKISKPDKFEITSGFSTTDIISVTASEIPFWSIENFEGIKNKMLDSFLQLLK